MHLVLVNASNLGVGSCRTAAPGLHPGCRFGSRPAQIGSLTGVNPRVTDGKSLADDIEERVIDGIRMIFHSTLGTEAPAEMNTYLPDMKAFWAAENITGTIHNITPCEVPWSEMHSCGRRRSERLSTCSARKPRSCLPLTAGRVGVMSGSKKSCTARETPMPTSTAACSIWRTKASPSTRSTTSTSSPSRCAGPHPYQGGVSVRCHPPFDQRVCCHRRETSLVATPIRHVPTMFEEM